MNRAAARAPLEVAHGDPERMREQPADAAALDQGRAEVRRRFGPHRLGGGQAGGAADRAEDADQRGHDPGEHGERDCGAVELEAEFGEARKKIWYITTSRRPSTMPPSVPKTAPAATMAKPNSR